MMTHCVTVINTFTVSEELNNHLLERTPEMWELGLLQALGEVWLHQWL